LDGALGFLVGLAVAASVVAVLRLVRAPRRILSPEAQAMQAALHAAAATLPSLRRGLDRESAPRAAPHLLTLTQGGAVALVTHEEVLAFAGAGSHAHAAGDPVELLVPRLDSEGTVVETRLPCADASCPLRSAVIAPILVGADCVGHLAVLYAERDIAPEDVRVASEAASLVAAQVALAVLETQGERIARAELRALRAQISPHFIYNALAAVSNSIHARPDEARELLSEFAAFIRYAFREERPYVTLADELHYVEKYLRLEQARFGDRLQVRVAVAPEVLQAVVPALSLQPLVENAVRHGVEANGGRGRVEIVGSDLDQDVEICVVDTGAGMDAERAAAALAGRAGGIGLANVHARLRSTFGEDYGLEVRSERGRGTTVAMTLPKFRAGVRAA
jgi:two-component system LytT family sensor kinase